MVKKCTGKKMEVYGLQVHYMAQAYECIPLYLALHETRLNKGVLSTGMLSSGGFDESRFPGKRVESFRRSAIEVIARGIPSGKSWDRALKIAHHKGKLNENSTD